MKCEIWGGGAGVKCETWEPQGAFLSVGQGFSHFTLPGKPGFHISRAFGGPGFHISRALGGARVSHFTRPRGGQGFTFHAPLGGQGFTFHASALSGGQGFTFHAPSGGPGFHISRALGGARVSHFTLPGAARVSHFTRFREPGFHISRALGRAMVSHFTRPRGGQGFTFHAPSKGPGQGFTFHAGPSGGARVSHSRRAFGGRQGFTFHAGPSGGDARVSHFTGLSRVSQITGLRTGWGHQGLTFVGSLRVPSFFAFHELSEGGQGSRGLQCHDHGVTGITTIREVTGSHWSRFRLSRKHSHRRVEQLFGRHDPQTNSCRGLTAGRSVTFR